MRTREMLYKDWGISEQRRRELMRAAREEANLELLRIALKMSNEALAPFLEVSLRSPAAGEGPTEVASKGFKKTWIGDWMNRSYPLCKADDFYAYRRLALFIFDKLLRLEEVDEKIDFSEKWYS